VVFLQVPRARFGIAAVVALIVLTAPSIASAASGNCSASACQQYNETLPGAGGKSVPGGHKKTTSKLSKKSRNSLNQLSNPSSKKTLENMATNSQFGNATANLKKVKTPTRSLKSSVGSSLAASILSSGAGSKARLVVLLTAIVAISAGIGVAAVRRQRI